MDRDSGDSGTAAQDGRDSKPLVERAKAIIFEPRNEWPQIAAEPATIGGIYASYVLILAAIPPLAYALGALFFGGPMFEGLAYRPTPGAMAGYAVVLYVLGLISVYVMALIIDALAPSFGGQKDRVRAFKVAAYSSTASWLAGVFSLVPALSWLSILGLYSLYLLRLGLPRLMAVPEERGLGYTIVVVIAALILWIVVGAIGALVIGGAILA